MEYTYLQKAFFRLSYIFFFTIHYRQEIIVAKLIVPEPVWTLYRREKFCPYWESNPISPARILSLYRLSRPASQFHKAWCFLMQSGQNVGNLAEGN
jgi:hypothetical protein